MTKSLSYSVREELSHEASEISREITMLVMRLEKMQERLLNMEIKLDPPVKEVPKKKDTVSKYDMDGYPIEPKYIR